MAGILDNKERILDIHITKIGREKILEDGFLPKFVSYSDRNTFYKGDINSGSDDASQRIFFESNSRMQDLVITKRSRGTRTFKNKIGNYAYDGSEIHDIGNQSPRNFQAVSASVDGFLERLGNNFSDHYLLKENNNFEEDSEFQIKTKSGQDTFFIELDRLQTKIASIVSQGALFQDERMSNSLSFLYMPPVDSKDPDRKAIGEFACRSVFDESNLGTIRKKVVNRYVNNENNLPVIKYSLEPEEAHKDLVIQVFEKANIGFHHLDIVDFGEIEHKDGNRYRIFFIGKVIEIPNYYSRFVNIMTVLFK